MDMYDSLFSQGGVLNEQIARQIFDVLPESGPIVLIMDKDGNSWPSDSERFSQLNIDESFLKDTCHSIDDGHEPIITQTNDCSVVATQLATDRTNCGYVIIILSHYSPESTLINIDLVEIILNQIGLVAKLIEKNNQLYELQMKYYSEYGSSQITSN